MNCLALIMQLSTFSPDYSLIHIWFIELEIFIIALPLPLPLPKVLGRLPVVTDKMRLMLSQSSYAGVWAESHPETRVQKVRQVGWITCFTIPLAATVHTHKCNNHLDLLNQEVGVGCLPSNAEVCSVNSQWFLQTALPLECMKGCLVLSGYCVGGSRGWRTEENFLL